jgi:hypothetical protein
LLIATELYALGGHSRVLEDVSHEAPNPVILLTDLFHSYSDNPATAAALQTRFAHATVIVLPSGSYWDKCKMLRRMALEMNPRDILYFGHHQDPIPYVSTLCLTAPAKLLIHHADHNASLGCTLADVAHVDLSEGVREVCAAHLAQPAHLLPLYVPDLGVKIFPAVQGSAFSVVTSGHPAKFARGGPLALQSLVQATLSAVQGAHHHIGPMDEAWITEIRAHLSANGIDHQRFIHHGMVPSLWSTLKTLDAAVYIGSAPSGGGRAAIEAQGCGYPVVFFDGGPASGLCTNEGLYANCELRWSTTDELVQMIISIGPVHGALSEQARRLYLDKHSRAPFQNSLRRLLRA